MPTMDFSQPVLVSAILVGSLILFITDKFRVDFVAIVVMAALAVTGVVAEADLFKGFASPLRSFECSACLFC